MLLFPYLLFPLLMVLLIIIPFKFTINSLLTLIYTPLQLIKIASNRRLRKNHALEHATINVIEEYYGDQRLSGMAREDGFFILGQLPPGLVEKAARVGLQRLKSGASELVVHKRCGTSLAMANLVSALVFIFLLLNSGHFTFFYLVLALLAAHILGPVLGRIIQRHLTTSTDLSDLFIAGARTGHRQQNIFGFSFSRPDRIFIETYQQQGRAG